MGCDKKTLRSKQAIPLTRSEVNPTSHKMVSRIKVLYSRSRNTNSSLIALVRVSTAAGWAFLPIRSHLALILESASRSDFSLGRNRKSLLVNWQCSLKGRWSSPERPCPQGWMLVKLCGKTVYERTCTAVQKRRILSHDVQIDSDQSTSNPNKN